MISYGDWPILVPIPISLAALGGGYAKWRADEYRKSEVADWGRRCIETTRLLAHLAAEGSVDTQTVALLSAHIDEGRIYFRNVPSSDRDLSDWNAHRASAFRHIRPAILDPLVACYDATRAKGPFDEPAFREAEEQFVSLLQTEVGRAIAFSRMASAEGKGSPLDRFARLANERKAIEDQRRDNALK